MAFEDKFTGRICGYEVEMTISSEMLSFLLTQLKSKHKYSAKIPYTQNTGLTKTIQDIFTSLDSLFLYISEYSEDTRRVFIHENGRMKVTYNTSRIYRRDCPFVYIQAKRVVHNTEEGKVVVVDDIKKENQTLRSLAIKLAVTISITKKKLKEIKQTVRYWRYSQHSSELSSSDSDSDSEDVQSKQHETKDLVKEQLIIEAEKDDIVKKEYQQDNQNIQNKSQADIKEQHRPFQHNNRTDQLLGTKLIIHADVEWSKFIAQQYQVKDNIIIKIGQYSSFQVLSQQIIPQTNKIYFSVYIKKIKYNNILIGVCCERRRGMQNSHLTRDVLLYSGRNGQIIDNIGSGCQNKDIMNISQDITLMVSVDISNGVVVWFADFLQIGRGQLSETLQKQPLVAYIQLNYPKSQVHLNSKNK